MAGKERFSPTTYQMLSKRIVNFFVKMAVNRAQPERFMNVMTYAGYPNEDKDPLTGRHHGGQNVPALLPLQQAGLLRSHGGGHAPDFRVTNRVYIIRHGDGEHNSKFQVTKFERDSYAHTDTYGVRWENLD